MAGSLRIGIGGWSYEPWRGTFYPPGLSAGRELEFASRAVTTIEINGTFYSSFKPDVWRKWRDETPDDFVFAVKGSRFCTVRNSLASAGNAIRTFFAQGIIELGNKLGPINWQFDEAKEFEPEDVCEFLKLLPEEVGGMQIRHAVEAQHAGFDRAEFFDMLAERGIQAVYTDAGYISRFPETGDFKYARIKSSAEQYADGFTDEQLNGYADRALEWSKCGDVYLYFIDGAKVRNPAAAQALIRKLAVTEATGQSARA